jgi:hypothetical protein
MRATQSHSFIDLIFRASILFPIAFFPLDFHCQPIDVGELAARLAGAVAFAAGWKAS